MASCALYGGRAMRSIDKELFQDLYGLVVPSGWRRHRYAVFIGLFCVVIIAWMMFSGHHHASDGESLVLAPDTTDSLADNVRWLSSRKRQSNFKQMSRQAIINSQRTQALSGGSVGVKDHSHHVSLPFTSKRLEAPIQIYKHQERGLSGGEAKQLQSRSAYMLLAGEVIDASIESAVSTDLSGQVRAMVSMPVYSYTGRHVLIPIGARLLGHYQTVSHEQQMRIWIRWDRVILPSGLSVMLDAPSMGPMGQTGSRADKVNRHAWERFKDAALLSMLSNTALLAGGMDASTETAGQVARLQVAERFSSASEQSWVSSHTYQPTAFLYPGHQIKIYVMHDVDCKPLRQATYKER